MSAGMSPEAGNIVNVAQMVDDRDAGTPGPWVADDNEGYSPWGVWQGYTPTGNGKAGRLVARIAGDDAQAGFDAARVERLPDLEAAYITLAAENATLRASVTDLQEKLAKMEKSEAAALDRVKVLEAALLDAGAMRDAADRVSEWFCTEARQFEGPRIQGLRMAIVAYDRHMQPNPALTPTADKE